MRSCLLVEGPSGCGKTTSILRVCGSMLHNAGGFATRRIYTENGDLYGFCQCDPKNFAAADMKYTENAKNVFLRVGKSGAMYPEVFSEYTLKCLKDGFDAPFCLLDELGGFELLMPEINRALFDLINKGVPIVGVWKNDENSRRMAANLKLCEEYRDRYEKVRLFLLENPNVELVSVKNGADEVWNEKLTVWAEQYAAKSIKKGLFKDV